MENNIALLTKSHKNAILINIVFICSFFLLLLQSIQPIHPFDEFFYLQAGKDYLEKGLSPWIDHYSFTFSGEEVKYFPVLYGITFASIVSYLDLLFGYQFFLALHFFIILTALFFYTKKIESSWQFTLLIVPILLYFLLLRINPRPELLGNALIIVCLILYFKARSDFSYQNLILISLVMLFWVNWHTPIFGYIIIFALFVDKFFDKVFKRGGSFTWRFWAFWGIIIFCIGFIHPNNGHFFIELISFGGKDWSSIVHEFVPIDSEYFYRFQYNLLLFGAAISIIFFTIKKQYGLVFIILILIAASALMHRLLTQSSIIILLLLMYVLSNQDSKNFISSLKPIIQKALSFTWGVIILFTLIGLTNWGIELYSTKGLSQLKENIYPVETVNYLKLNKKQGHVFNDFGLGGYNIYNLPSGFKVFWDGRLNLLYPFEFAKKYLEGQQNFANVFSNEADNYQIDYVVLKIDQNDYFIVTQHKDYFLEYVGKTFFLFSKESDNQENNLKVSSKLSLFPMCWEPSLHEDILGEQKKTQSVIFPRNSRMKRLFSVVSNYESHENKLDAFNQNYIQSLKGGAEKRLLAYMAIKSKQYSAAMSLFSTLETRENQDLLMLIAAMLKVGELEQAMELITILSSSEKMANLDRKPLVPFEKAILLTLIEGSKGQLNFSPEESRYIEELENNSQSGNFNYSLPLESIFPEAGCKKLFST